MISVLFMFSAGILSLCTYLSEIFLSSGVLGAEYLTIDPNEDQATLLIFATHVMRLFHHIFALSGCIITAAVWTRQFKIWANFSKAQFVKSFYIVGVAIIILFVVQLITITLQYIFYWTDYEHFGQTPPEIPENLEMIFMVLFLVATVVLIVYIYYLTAAGSSMRVPYQAKASRSQKRLFLPFFFLFLWFFTNILNVSAEAGIANSIVTFVGNLFLLAAYAPISFNFMKFARNVDSKFLQKNLYLAAIGTLGLSTFNIVGPSRWTGMGILVGYLVAFSILTWSLANISQFLGSREALSRRLREAGVQFLSDMGEAEMKAQSIKQMAKVMTDVSNGFMQDLTKMIVRSPPTEAEIRRYIVSTMGVEATPSEREVLAYLQDAISFAQKGGRE